ncbi:MAG: NHLP bacteriocin system secretion protein [Gammaproteobacteria bacterium]|jgi:biotin carboxyl carrier protein
MAKIRFRKEATKKIFSPEQLDLLTTIAPSRNWLILVTIAVLLVFVVFWGFFGAIPTTVDVRGIVIDAAVNDVYAPVTGYNQSLNIKLGDQVHAGEELLRIIPPDLYIKLVAVKSRLEKQRNNQKLQQELISINKQIMQQAIYVISPYTGRIVELDIQSGEYVDKHQLLLRIERFQTDAAGLHAILFVSPIEGKRIKTGMKVQLAPSTVRPEEYGYLLGKVSYVSKYSVTSFDIVNILGNRDFTKAFSRGLMPLEVRVKLIPDSKTQSGYKWSSSKGPPIRIDSGTFCMGKVIIGRIRPINLVLPALRGAF